MASNVIRQDVVQIALQSNLDELKKLKKDLDDLKKKLGLIDDDPLEDVDDAAKKSHKSVTKLNGAVSKLGSGLKKVTAVSFKGLAVGLGAAATGVGKIAYEATQAYADFEQLEGGVKKLFGTGSAKNVEEYADTVGKSVKSVQKEYEKLVGAQETVLKNSLGAYKTSGVSANKYMETVTGFSASLITSLKGNTQAAADWADVALTDMADNANTFGTDMEQVITTYQNLAKEQYMTLDNLKLGFGGTKEGAQDLTKAASKLDKTVKAGDLSFSNMVKAIHVMQKSMKISGISYKEYQELVESGTMTQEQAFALLGTTAKEANFTVTGSFNQLKGALENVLIAMGSGENMDIAFNNLTESFEIFLGNVAPVVERSLLGIGAMVEKFAPVISEKFPALIDKLLPPLLKAAASLVAGFIKAMPDIIKNVAEEIPNITKEIVSAIYEAFTGKEFDGEAFTKMEGFIKGLANTIKWSIPIIGGLVVAFKGLKTIRSIKSVFSGLGKSKDSGDGKGKGSGGGIFGVFNQLANMKVTTVLKGIANLSIILGALGALLFIATKVFRSGVDFKQMLKVITLIGILGAVGLALSKFSGVVGMIPIMTVAKDLANIAIILVGVGALLFIATKVFSGGVDFVNILKVITLIGILGAVGLALSKFSGVVGMIPIMTVAKDLANIAIILVGVGALLFIATKVFSGGVDFVNILKVITLIGILGTVGTGLTVFAGLVGLIPISTVLMGLINIGLVMGGFGALLFAATKVFSSGINFNEMLQVVVLIGIIGTVGTLLSGLAAIIGLIPFPLVLSGLVNIGLVFAGLSKLIEPSRKFFEAVATFPIAGFIMAEKMFECLAGLKNLPKDGGFLGLFKGNTNYSKIAEGLGALSSEGVQRFFTMVGGLPITAFTNTSLLFNALAGIENMPKEGGLFGWAKEKTNLGDIGAQLSEFAKNAARFLTFVNTLNVENMVALFDALQNLDDIVLKLNNNISADFEAIATNVKLSCIEVKNQIKDTTTKINSIISSTNLKPSSEKMMQTFINGIASKKQSAVAVIKSVVSSIISQINNVIRAANYTLKEFGSKDRISAYKYANGTTGHPGGNAIVNDGRGAEMVQMPNGNTFIPKGRNVFLPNAPKGMKVLPAENTATLMGRNKPTFHYAKGTGDVDIWDYMDNSKGLVSRLKDKFVDYKNLSGAGLSIAKGAVTTVSGAMVSWLDKMFEEFGIGKGWKWPSLSRRITSPFGKRKSPGGIGLTNHKGIDIGAPYGSPVFASKGGTVSMAGWSGGYGNLVQINHGQGFSTRYAHNSTLLVSPGQRVRQGQTIALVGSTGNSTGPHIHFEIRRNGASLNPLSMFGNGYANGGLVTKPGWIGEEHKPEMVIPLSKNKRRRALSLWEQTGTMLGYTPENSTVGSSQVSNVENTYAPQFVLNVNGTNDDRNMERKVKRWIKESMDEVFNSMARKNPRLREV